MPEPNGWHVAVPSYQRPAGIARKTLPMLLDRGVTPDAITVFLHDNDPHLDVYRQTLGYLGVNMAVTPARGIGQQRQAITEHFEPGTPIVSIDDDLSDVLRATGPKTLEPVPNLAGFFTAMFRETLDRDLYVWGISPVPNAYFLRPGRIGEGLKFLMFTMFGFINRPGHPVHQSTVRYKDEHEFSLRAWWYDGATVRADDTAVKAEYYAPGGCQAAGRNYAQVEESVRSLLRQWPNLVRRNTRRRSEWPEIALARRGRHGGHAPDVPPPGDAPQS